MKFLRRYRLVVTLLGITFPYLFYIDGVSTNPPGFYIDESAIAYNAYCIAHTGAGEFGSRLPLFFPVYTGGWIQYANPTQIYLLAIPFAFRIGRRGTLAGIGVGLGLGMVFLLSNEVFTRLGAAGALSPALAAWSPDILFATGSTYLLLRLRT